MPTKPPTYDDITRRTVIEPDSSFRPTPEQVRQAREGFRALDQVEQALLDRVRAALVAAGVDVGDVELEVDRDTVVVSGRVRDPDALGRIPELIRAIDGVGSVVDHLVIAAT